MCFKSKREKPSWISKVIAAIKEVRNYFHHGFKEADFVAWLAAKYAKLLAFHCSRSLLLRSKSVLPCEICLVPMVGGNVCYGCICWLIGRT